MSKNSNKKQLNSRLSNVFSDLDKPQVFPGLNPSSDISGWIWEMTPEGIISGCSPEVEIFLEIPSQSLIGTEIFSFSDFNFDAANLPTDPNRALMPTTISINFRRGDDSIVPTTTYIMGKLDEDGNLLSWRGITSAQEIEEPPVVEKIEPEELADEEPMGLVTMEDVPEILQPDTSVMDVWAHNEKDTSPLDPQDLIKHGPIEEPAEEVDPPILEPQDDIETIRDTSYPASQTMEVEDEEIEEEVEVQTPDLQAEEAEPEIQAASFPVEPEVPSVEIEETVELSAPVEQQDTSPEVELKEPDEAVAQEPLASEAPLTWIPEFVSHQAEPEPVEDAEIEEPVLPAVQDGIETIRYTSYPVTPEQVSQPEDAVEEVMQEEPSITPEEGEQIVLDSDLAPAAPEITEPPAWEPEFSEPEDDEVQTFIPLDEPAQPVFEEESPAEALDTADLPSYEAAEEVEPQISGDSPTWKPPVPEEILVEETVMDADFEDHPEPVLEEEPPVAPEDGEVGGIESIALEIDETPTLTPPYAEEMTAEQPEIEAVQETTPEVEPATDLPSLLEEIETPAAMDQIVTEPLEPDEVQSLAAEYAPPAEETPVVEPTSEEEMPPRQISFKEPDTQPVKPFEEEPEKAIARVDSVSMIPDLDLQKEELESPDKEVDTDSLDPFPDKPQTGSRRRPMIDTASLIPSLLKDPKDTEEKETDKLPLDAFLRDAEGESIQIDTKELETLTSADGTELSISRGVQELLKIVDNNPNREWRDDELQLVDQVHTQLELALENANLFQQTQIALAETDERARQLRLLNQMSEEINQTDDLLEIYGIVTDKTIQIFSGQRVSITILTEGRTELEVVAATGDTSPMPIGTRFPLQDTSNEVVVRENRVFIPPGKRSLKLGEVQSTMIGPITVSNNVIGTLNVGSSYQNAFNDRDANFLTQLLSILNASVENRRLFEQIETALSTTEEQARRLAILNQLSEKLTLAETFDQVISLILDHVNQILPVDEWAYTHVNEENDTYELFVAPDKLDDLPMMDGGPISMTQPLENSIVGKAAKDRRAIIEFNCLESSFDDVRLWAGERGVRTAMSSPILVGNQVIGVLNIGSKLQSAYTVQEENIMLSITSLAGSTIDNRQLLGQIQKRSVQLETSAEVSRVASTMLDPTELLPRVVELIKDGFDLYYAGIFLIDETGEFTGEPGKWAVLRAGSGEAGQQMIGTSHKLEIGGESMIGTAISTSQARIALSVGEEEHFFRNPFLPNTRSEMALPLTSRGEVLGALSIQSEVEDAFKQEDITALQTMADQLANAIENASLFEQTEMRAEELTVLNEMARGFTQTMDVDELIENTFQFTGRLMEASNFYMVLYYPDEQFYEFKLFVEEGQKMPPPRTRVKLGDGLTDWIIMNKLPVLIPADTETHLMALGIEPRDRMAKSWLGVPMLLGNVVTGVIAVQSYQKANTYNSHSLDLLIAVSSQAAVAIDNARRFQATQTRARHEEILRRVTTQVHSTSDPEAILRTAVREVSDALGKPAFVKLNPQERSVGITTEKPEQTEQDTIPPLTPPAPGDPEAR